ncbi:MAG: lysophospholipid acyltransferase family protein [Phycisphaerae bacterium]|nr:lysophospholipid acyltransferase family protein [Phycisphaerae bacterium]
MALPRNKVLDYLVYIAMRLFAMFVHMFPPAASYRTAGWMGSLVYHVDRRHRRRSIEHVRRSFPDWSEQEVRRVAQESLKHLVYLGLEVLLTPRLITPLRWHRYVRLANLSEALRILLERRTGVILVTGHYGNFELVGYTMATLGFPSVSVARPLDNSYINEFVLGVRQRTGQTILHKRGATASIEDVLAARGTLAFLADQDAGRKGLFVDFFGRPASTYKSIGLMAMQFGAPIVVGYGRRLDEAFHFELGVQRIIHPRDWRGKTDPLAWITREFTGELERIVRKAPEQYLWVHRRWKHRPNGEQPDEDGIA